MRCPECGRELENEELICKNCGARRSAGLNSADLEDILNTKPSVSAEQLKPKPVDEYFSEVEAYVNRLLTEPVECQEEPAESQEEPAESQAEPAECQEELARSQDVLPRRRRRTGIVIGCVVVLCLTAASAFWLLQKQKANHAALAAFEQSTQQLQILDDVPDSKLQEQVKELYETCIQAVKNKKYGSFDALTKDIDALMKTVTETTDLSRQFLELQTKYETLDENYDLSANERKQWERFMNEAASASADVGASDYDTLSQSMEDFVQALRSANEDRIEGIQTSVAQMDLTKATVQELEQLKALENQMNGQMLSGQYKQALETGDAWQKLAKQISDRAAEEIENADADGDVHVPASGEGIPGNSDAGDGSTNGSGVAGGDDTADSDTDAELEFIFKDSDSRYLTEEDLEGMDDWQLLMARNEIYARHGRLFSNPEIQAYFNEKSWYSGTVKPEVFDAQVMDIFNEYELANIEFIRSHEKLQ